MSVELFKRVLSCSKECEVVQKSVELILASAPLEKSAVSESVWSFLSLSNGSWLGMWGIKNGRPTCRL